MKYGIIDYDVIGTGDIRRFIHVFVRKDRIIMKEI